MEKPSRQYVIVCRRHYYGPRSVAEVYGPLPNRAAALEAIAKSGARNYHLGHNESRRPTYRAYPQNLNYTSHRSIVSVDYMPGHPWQ